MSKKEKLLLRIKNNQNNIRFQDFCLLMTYFGFVLQRVRGSHYMYMHPSLSDIMNVQPTPDGMAKAYQVRQFLSLIENHNLQLSRDNYSEGKTSDE